MCVWQVGFVEEIIVQSSGIDSEIIQDKAKPKWAASFAFVKIEKRTQCTGSRIHQGENTQRTGTSSTCVSENEATLIQDDVGLARETSLTDDESSMPSLSPEGKNAMLNTRSTSWLDAIIIFSKDVGSR